MDEDAARAAADRVVELEEEVEASGTAATDAAQLARARAALHAWVDEVIAVVVSLSGHCRTLVMSAPDPASASQQLRPEAPAPQQPR